MSWNIGSTLDSLFEDLGELDEVTLLAQNNGVASTIAARMKVVRRAVKDIQKTADVRRGPWDRAMNRDPTRRNGSGNHEKPGEWRFPGLWGKAGPSPERCRITTLGASAEGAGQATEELAAGRSQIVDLGSPCQPTPSRE